ncbi:EXOSC9 [Bugula neritina]|uniref:EXOSC9 n=1 Tax=Bugula neritina TaxID=10212 RepID=A0A7J7KRY5_BUGNE|nr:EXOSC9 [Bugula neritina]
MANDMNIMLISKCNGDNCHLLLTMKDKPLANCEREFLLQLIERTKRLDDRRAFDYRNIKIEFGADYGCCHVHIGETLILAQVTCSMIEPKQTRPNEGALMINIEFNHVACPGFEPGRLSRKGVQINRLLERCLKECKCIDLESLCVIAEKQNYTVKLTLL